MPRAPGWKHNQFNCIHACMQHHPIGLDIIVTRASKPFRFFP